MDFGDFDTIDPFFQNPDYRLHGMHVVNSDHEIFKIFLRNYCCYIYKKNESNLRLIFQNGARPSLIYHNIVKLTFLERNPISHHFETFAKYEETKFRRSKNSIGRTYLNFINYHFRFFNILDKLCKPISYNALFKDNSFIKLLSKRGIDLDCLDAAGVDLSFKELEKNLYIAVFESYIEKMNLDCFQKQHLVLPMRKLQLYLNSSLLLDLQKSKIQEQALKWFKMSLDTLLFQIHLEELPLCLEELYKDFGNLLPLVNNSEPNFPSDVFKNYKAYLLFDTVARGVTTRVLFCFLYRYLFDKGLIKIKDTPFREWFNGQSYTLQLTSITDTLEKCTSNDRTLFLKIIAKMLDVKV